MKRALFVVGPAGSGKTTLCEAIQDYLLGKNCGILPHYVNLDPASNIPQSKSNNAWDIREKWNLEDVMRLYQLGPNGALMYILESFGKDAEHLAEKLQPWQEDFLIVDCPGQIEAYIHQEGGMNSVISTFKDHGYDIIILFTLDSTFINNHRKMLLGVLISLVSMLHLGEALLIVVTKMDVVGGVEEWDSLQDSLQDFLNTQEQNSFLGKLGNIFDKFGISEIIPVDVTEPESIAFLHGRLCNILGQDEDQVNFNDNDADHDEE